jgi:hypothetical protein
VKNGYKTSMLRKEGSVGHNDALNLKNAEWPEATIKIWNLIVQTEQQTTLNTMSTTNLAETQPESLREVREFEDVKVRI